MASSLQGVSEKLVCGSWRKLCCRLCRVLGGVSLLLMFGYNTSLVCYLLSYFPFSLLSHFSLSFHPILFHNCIYTWYFIYLDKFFPTFLSGKHLLMLQDPIQGPPTLPGPLSSVNHFLLHSPGVLIKSILSFNDCCLLYLATHIFTRLYPS